MSQPERRIVKIPERFSYALMAIFGTGFITAMFLTQGSLLSFFIGLAWSCIVAKCVKGFIGKLIAVISILFFIFAIITFLVLCFTGP